MNNSIQPFDFKGTPIRALADKDGTPWLVAKDVCDVLGLATNHIREALDEDEVSNLRITEVGENGGREPLIVSEAGFYKLVMRSRKPEAKEFQRWVTHEVLPSIRKHGAYMTDEVIERTLTDPDYLIQLATQLKDQKAMIADQQRQITEQAPKVLFADALETSKSTILIGQLAKLLKQNGVEIGQNRLYVWLRDHGYLSSRRGDDWNTPTQKAMGMKLFQIRTNTVIGADGRQFVNHVTLVTGKGQTYFVNKFLAKTQEVSA